MKTVRQYTQQYQLIGAAITFVLCAGIVGGYLMVKQREVPLAYKSDGVTIPWLPKTVTRFKDTIEKQAKRYNIDANVVAIVMTLESGGFTKANSGVARGLMQVTDPTGGDIAKMYLQKPVNTYDLYDPLTSIEFGVAYLAQLRNTLCDYTDGPSWNACVEYISAGYNGGPGAAIRLGSGKGLLDTQTVIYSRNAFNMWRERAAETSPTYTRWLAAGGETLVQDAEAEIQKQ